MLFFLSEVPDYDQSPYLPNIPEILDQDRWPELLSTFAGIDNHDMAQCTFMHSVQMHHHLRMQRLCCADYINFYIPQCHECSLILSETCAIFCMFYTSTMMLLCCASTSTFRPWLQDPCTRTGAARSESVGEVKSVPGRLPADRIQQESQVPW